MIIKLAEGPFFFLTLISTDYNINIPCSFGECVCYQLGHPHPAVWVPLPLCGVTCSWCCEHDARSLTVTIGGLSHASAARCPACTSLAAGQLGH